MTKDEELQTRLFVPRSNTETGRSILENAPPLGTGFGQFIGFLVATLLRGRRW